MQTICTAAQRITLKVALMIERGVRMVSLPLVHPYELEWTLQRHWIDHHVQLDEEIMGCLVRAGFGGSRKRKPVMAPQSYKHYRWLLGLLRC